MKKVLVAGATGYLGRYVVKALKEQGYWVRVLVRNSNRLNEPGNHLAPPVLPYIDDIFQGEVTQPQTLAGVCDGVDYVFSSIGITRQKDGVTFKDVDYQGNMNLLLEAEASMAKKFMFVSVFKGNELRGTLTDAKERFVRRLKQSSISHIIIRPTGYFSDMGEFLQMAVKGRVYLIGNGYKKMNPIHGADLADFCVKGLSRENAELYVGGPQIFTHREIATLAFQTTGNREKISFIPQILFQSAIYPLKILSSNQYGAAQFLYNAMTHDLIAPCTGTQQLLSYFQKVFAHL